MAESDSNTVKQIKTAVDCIKHSPICTDSRYSWIQPSIESILGDEFDPSSLTATIRLLMSSIKRESALPPESLPEASEQPSPAQESHAVIRLKSIDCVSNVGLLTSLQPIELNERLNVFFGKNASDKSSLYLAICKTLGRPKSIFPDVSSNSQESTCELSYVDASSELRSLSWKSGQINPDLKIKIFDTAICNSVVIQDQINEFEIAHLKAEYFAFLYDLFDGVQSELYQYSQQLGTRLSEQKISLEKSVPFLFNTSIVPDIAKLKYVPLTESEESELQKIEKRLKILNKQLTDAIIKNLTNARSRTEKVLSVLGYEEEGEDDVDASQPKWQFKYDRQYFEANNREIKDYATEKATYDKAGKQKLPSSIPEDWIENDLWRDFIKKSIQFIAYLDGKLKDKYRDETCLYCLQPLETPEARALVKAYHELHDEHEARLTRQLLNIQKKSRDLTSIIALLPELPKINHEIEAEFENIGRKGQAIANYNNLEEQFTDIKSHIDLQRQSDIKEDFLQSLSNLWHEYKDLWLGFSEEIESLESALKDTEVKIKKLESQAGALQQKKLLYENKDAILNYITVQESEKQIQNYQRDLTVLKRLTSSLKTKFSNEETIKEFKKSLDAEYANLGFSPPESWHIYPVTRDGVNRRVYNLGDKRLAEIFSEGEKTIHALADFFAQCEVDKYRGLYIFDDPVNSLDEDNIKYVADRVKSLVQTGNQVLIFTHSLPFLHSLINPERDRLTHLERSKCSIVVESNTLLDSANFLRVRFQVIDGRICEMTTTHKAGKRISEFAIRGVYDIMSGYMETWVEKVLLQDVVTRYRPNIRMDSLRRLENINLTLISKAHAFYERTSRNCLRHSQHDSVPNPTFDSLLNDFKEFQTNFHYKA